ncbi:MAG TPA: hypothetical protein VGH74_13520 [Planctomycetaceae bacterium]
MRTCPLQKHLSENQAFQTCRLRQPANRLRSTSYRQNPVDRAGGACSSEENGVGKRNRKWMKLRFKPTSP